ncbi:MAG: hypothetical protein ACYCSN_01920 [Acidobacteriaceae bacterium]
MRKLAALAAFAAALFLSEAARAQSRPDSFLVRYQARVSATQAAQPHWITPLVLVTPRLEQELRTDFVRQRNASAQDIWIYDNGKGLELIPFRHVELLFNTPPFVAHAQKHVADGFGDVTFLAKYRFYGSNEQHRNAIITAFLGGSIPTGKNGNGSCCASLTPTLAVGKGWRRLDLSSTAGGTLPVSNVAKLGHQILWNSVAQYHAGRFLWPEFEINSTFFKGSANDGKAQTFATPGLVIGRIPLTHDATGKPGRLGLTFGAGEQIALTRFHTYNHALIFTARMPF